MVSLRAASALEMILCRVLTCLRRRLVTCLPPIRRLICKNGIHGRRLGICIRATNQTNAQCKVSGELELLSDLALAVVSHLAVEHCIQIIPVNLSIIYFEVISDLCDSSGSRSGLDHGLPLLVAVHHAN